MDLFGYGFPRPVRCLRKSASRDSLLNHASVSEASAFGLRREAVVDVAAGMQQSIHSDEVRMLEIEDEVGKSLRGDIPKTWQSKNLGIAKGTHTRRFADGAHCLVNHVGESIGNLGAGIQEVLAIGIEEVLPCEGRKLYWLHGAKGESVGRSSFNPDL